MHNVRWFGTWVMMAMLSAVPGLAQNTGAFNPVPALDLSGNWAPMYWEDQPERIPGPELVNYAGLPINDAARAYALAWDASRFTVPEHECEAHGIAYIYRGPLNLRISEMRDPVTQRLIAIKQYIDNYEQSRDIWMDGRPHPPEGARHTWMGFSTGKYEGNTLTVYTTHIKQGWIRRNGLRHSDQATVTEHFMRHSDHLVHVMLLTDPLTITEPLIKSQDFVLRVQNGQTWVYPCESVVEIPRPRGVVPHFQPGANPFLREFADQFKIPLAAALGGAETGYPEYQMKIKAMEAAK